MTTIQRIKRAWRNMTDVGPRIYLHSPIVVLPSRRQCEEVFFRHLNEWLTRAQVADKLTNAELADKLEELAMDTGIFSEADEFLDEAARRLRGPGVDVATLTTDRPTPEPGVRSKFSDEPRASEGATIDSPISSIMSDPDPRQ